MRSGSRSSRGRSRARREPAGDPGEAVAEADRRGDGDGHGQQQRRRQAPRHDARGATAQVILYPLIPFVGSVGGRRGSATAAGDEIQPLTHGTTQDRLRGPVCAAPRSLPARRRPPVPDPGQLRGRHQPLLPARARDRAPALGVHPRAGRGPASAGRASARTPPSSSRRPASFADGGRPGRRSDRRRHRAGRAARAARSPTRTPGATPSPNRCCGAGTPPANVEQPADHGGHRQRRGARRRRPATPGTRCATDARDDTRDTTILVVGRARRRAARGADPLLGADQLDAGAAGAASSRAPAGSPAATSRPGSRSAARSRSPPWARPSTRWRPRSSGTRASETGSSR